MNQSIKEAFYKDFHMDMELKLIFGDKARRGEGFVAEARRKEYVATTIKQEEARREAIGITP